MTTPSERDREVARNIVGVRCDCNARIKKHGYKCVGCTLREDIAQAIAQAREEARAEAVVKLGKWEDARKATDAKQP